jgi:transglutaminase-like putative cysteine protease
MRIRIEHITTFTYDRPISEAYTEMNLRPLEGNGQHCLYFDLANETQDEILTYRDRFGNTVHHFDVIQPHQKLVVAARSEVITPDSFFQPQDSLSPLDEFDFLAGSSFAPLNRGIAQFAADRAPQDDPKAAAFSLMRAVNEVLKYEKGATDVTTTAEQALTLGRGVCQDFAHVMLAACRSRGIPARYVSGYLNSDGHDAASHAWLDVYLQGQGWISLDATHNREQTAQYVRVATGRDYGDVPPTRGIFVGDAREEMKVAVKVKVLA